MILIAFPKGQSKSQTMFSDYNIIKYCDPQHVSAKKFKFIKVYTSYRHIDHSILHNKFALNFIVVINMNISIKKSVLSF